MRNKLRFLSLAVLALASGCATTPYKPDAYKPAQERFGAIALPAGMPVYVCPVIDRLTPQNREALAPDFTPWTYVTEAIEAELKQAGMAPRRPSFPFGPGFDLLQKAIRDNAKPGDRVAFLGTELLALAPDVWILDARVFSPAGESLFTKRALFSSWGGLRTDDQQTAHMTLRQILADPAFRRALP